MKNKSIFKKRTRSARLYVAKGRLYVINKKNPKFKMRQG